MGYHIQYNHGCIETVHIPEHNRSKDKINRNKIILSIILCVLIACCYHYREHFIPGDRNVTKKAFTEMIYQIRSGEDTKTAITAFCREVLDGANLE